MKLKIIYTLFISLLFENVWAISEVNYKENYQLKILPLIQSYKHGNFLGKKSISIHYATYTRNPFSRRCLVILPGRTEAIEKYAEVIHSLDTGKLAFEFQFFLMDHRGQGSSGRMLNKVKDYEKGHVDDFNNYTLDMKKFLDVIVSEKNCREKYLLAHSLGAGIALDFLYEYPEYFDRVALSSPMLKIITKPYKYAVARTIIAANMLAKRGEKFGNGQGPHNPNRDFINNTFTSSEVRYNMAMDIFDHYPQTKLGGVTFGWLSEVVKATAKLRKNYEAFRIPMRVFHAGIEHYSEPDEAIELCEKAPYCKRIFLPTSKHEVLMDRDVNRDIVIQELESFFR